jgi:hypothetical protein
LDSSGVDGNAIAFRAEVIRQQSLCFRCGGYSDCDEGNEDCHAAPKDRHCGCGTAFQVFTITQCDRRCLATDKSFLLGTLIDKSLGFSRYQWLPVRRLPSFDPSEAKSYP